MEEAVSTHCTEGDQSLRHRKMGVCPGLDNKNRSRLGGRALWGGGGCRYSPLARPPLPKKRLN